MVESAALADQTTLAEMILASREQLCLPASVVNSTAVFQRAKFRIKRFEAVMDMPFQTRAWTFAFRHEAGRIEFQFNLTQLGVRQMLWRITDEVTKPARNRYYGKIGSHSRCSELTKRRKRNENNKDYQNGRAHV